MTCTYSACSVLSTHKPHFPPSTPSPRESSKLSSMADIPEDLIIKILSRLPVKSLIRFKCVCKPWFSLINDQNFIKLHLDTSIECNNLNLMISHSSSLSTIEYDSPFNQAKDIDYPFKTPSYFAEIFGSCNGLLCINPNENVHCLWNPSTKEYKLIPDAPVDVEFHFLGDWRTIHTICFGFGYDHSSDDYKVVRIDNLSDECSMHIFNFDVKVYSARTNSWKSVEVVPCYILYEKQSGVFVNGALHWAATRICNENYLNSVINVYNLAQEVFEEISLPDFENDEVQFCVGVLGGCLCLFCHVSPNNFDVWVMKDYGVEQSWRIHFSISLGSEPFEYLKPLCYCGDGYKVLADKDGNTLVGYDLISGDAKTTRIHGIPYWLDTMMYVGSLVSLNSGCYVRQEEAIGRTQQLLCEYTWNDDEVWAYWDGIHLML